MTIAPDNLAQRLRAAGFRAGPAALLALAGVLSLAACSGGDSNDCSASRTCATGGAAGNDGGGSGGSAGTSGTGGTSGSAGTGGSGGSAGTDGGAGSSGSAGAAGSDAATCDPTKAPSEDACVVADQYGVFVSPTGDDVSGDGSMTAPYATLAKALTEAKSAGKRVYACADGGDFTESVAIDASLDGLEVFGGLRCSDWAYSSALKTKDAAPDATAWTVTGLSAGLRVEDFEIDAADAAASGESSIAMSVASSTGVTLARVALHAGKGADGDDGAPGTAGADGAQTNTHVGVDADCASTTALGQPSAASGVR